MVMIILYMFWSTTRGIISIGIRFLWVHLYRFRRAATQPQGLLAATMLLMLSLAGLSYSLTMSVAPEYSMFGSQRYVSGQDHVHLIHFLACFQNKKR
jgi:LMBR1 domain-containing protein 1